MIVVLDSCVWVSALRFGGTPLVALRHTYNHHRIACCAEIEAEVERTLRGKFGWSRTSILETMNKVLKDALRVQISGTLTGICRDQNDNMVVECAAVARAEFIVSGDKDLLSLAVYKQIRILSPAEYIRLPIAS